MVNDLALLGVGPLGPEETRVDFGFLIADHGPSHAPQIVVALPVASGFVGQSCCRSGSTLKPNDGHMKSSYLTCQQPDEIASIIALSVVRIHIACWAQMAYHDDSPSQSLKARRLPK